MVALLGGLSIIVVPMTPDPFFAPEVVDMWESTTEMVGDASVARSVMEHLAAGFWNLEWEKWQLLAEAGRTKPTR